MEPEEDRLDLVGALWRVMVGLSPGLWDRKGERVNGCGEIATGSLLVRRGQVKTSWVGFIFYCNLKSLCMGNLPLLSQEIIEALGEESGYRLNYCKSEILYNLAPKDI